MIYFVILSGLFAAGVRHSRSMFLDVLVASDETTNGTAVDRDGRESDKQESPVGSRNSSSNFLYQSRLDSDRSKLRRPFTIRKDPKTTRRDVPAFLLGGKSTKNVWDILHEGDREDDSQVEVEFVERTLAETTARAYSKIRTTRRTPKPDTNYFPKSTTVTRMFLDPEVTDEPNFFPMPGRDFPDADEMVCSPEATDIFVVVDNRLMYHMPENMTYHFLSNLFYFVKVDPRYARVAFSLGSQRWYRRHLTFSYCRDSACVYTYFWWLSREVYADTIMNSTQLQDCWHDWYIPKHGYRVVDAVKEFDELIKVDEHRRRKIALLLVTYGASAKELEDIAVILKRYQSRKVKKMAFFIDNAVDEASSIFFEYAVKDRIFDVVWRPRPDSLRTRADAVYWADRMCRFLDDDYDTYPTTPEPPWPERWHHCYYEELDVDRVCRFDRHLKHCFLRGVFFSYESTWCPKYDVTYDECVPRSCENACILMSIPWTSWTCFATCVEVEDAENPPKRIRSRQYDPAADGILLCPIYQIEPCPGLPPCPHRTEQFYQQGGQEAEPAKIDTPFIACRYSSTKVCKYSEENVCAGEIVSVSSRNHSSCPVTRRPTPCDPEECDQDCKKRTTAWTAWTPCRSCRSLKFDKNLRLRDRRFVDLSELVYCPLRQTGACPPTAYCPDVAFYKKFYHGTPIVPDFSACGYKGRVTNCTKFEQEKQCLKIHSYKPGVKDAARCPPFSYAERCPAQSCGFTDVPPSGSQFPKNCQYKKVSETACQIYRGVDCRKVVRYESPTPKNAQCPDYSLSTGCPERECRPGPSIIDPKLMGSSCDYHVARATRCFFAKQNCRRQMTLKAANSKCQLQILDVPCERAECLEDSAAARRLQSPDLDCHYDYIETACVFLKEQHRKFMFFASTIDDERCFRFNVSEDCTPPEEKRSSMDKTMDHGALEFVADTHCAYKILKSDCLFMHLQCKRLNRLKSTPEGPKCPVFQYFEKCADRLCYDDDRGRVESMGLDTDADLECVYGHETDIGRCQQTDDGCKKLIRIGSMPNVRKCRNFAYWVQCPEGSCRPLKNEQRSKSAPWLNHECGYEFVEGSCERQQTDNSCARNNVFRPSTQGENCKPLEFVQSCNPNECDDGGGDFDQEVVPKKADAEEKPECVYRLTREYCRYHTLKPQDEPSCVALEIKSAESGFSCPQERKWAPCQASECRKRCDALLAGWSSWRPCLATCYSNDEDYAKGVWPYRLRHRPAASETAVDDAKFCPIREAGVCYSLPPCRSAKVTDYNYEQEAPMITVDKPSEVGDGSAIRAPRQWIFFVIAGLCMFFVIIIIGLVASLYFPRCFQLFFAFAYI